MARPRKSAKVIQMEGVNHMPPKELAAREKAEKAALTGLPMRPSDEVKDDPVALKKFREVKRLLGKLEKDDSLFSGQINRYALLYSEALKLRKRIADIDETLDAGCNAEDTKAFSEARGYLDAKLMKKREMMGTIERANCMTVQSSLNSAGKEPKKESATDQLMEVLGG